VNNNPAKAHFVRDPADWRWGSTRRMNAYGRLPEKLEAK